MPEGDTIFRAARTLNRALAGHVVTRFETQLPQLARIDEAILSRAGRLIAWTPQANGCASGSPAI
jgi:formamidopyrimidine-DNA glycosylase